MSVIHRVPGLVLTDHEFDVPLNYSRPDDEHISVFAREVVATGKERSGLPWLIFFQGGPGRKAPRPDGPGGWIKRALADYRVLLLDQRGTGRSSPANRQTLARRGGPAAQAAYLRHFRADAIVRDAEYIRRTLPGAEQGWSALGQSYGGFCVLTYLSFAPEGLREAMFTGGLPPIDRSADDIYRCTYRRVREQNCKYFARYPDDQARAHAIAAHLASNDVRLPNGDQLTVRRFQCLGGSFGTSDGFSWLHYLLDEAWLTGVHGDELNDTFLYNVMNATTLADHPLYAIMHESIYAQGSATRWAAERVRAEYSDFGFQPGASLAFTGEMIYPWMFDDDSALQPLKEAADLLASDDTWPHLYDTDQLRANTVPCAAAIYYDDMYVERMFSEETAHTIRGCRVWVTNEFQHDGLRTAGEAVLGRLIEMVRGER